MPASRVNGRAAAWIAADIVRFENGKLAEHWDVGQPIPDEDGLVTMTNGTREINQHANAEENKRVMKKTLLTLLLAFVAVAQQIMGVWAGDGGTLTDDQAP